MDFVGSLPHAFPSILGSFIALGDWLDSVARKDLSNDSDKLDLCKLLPRARSWAITPRFKGAIDRGPELAMVGLEPSCGPPHQRIRTPDFWKNLECWYVEVDIRVGWNDDIFAFHGL